MRSYLLALCAGAVLLLLGVAGVNLLVDPLARWGQAYGYGWNQSYSFQTFALRRDDPDGIIETLTRSEAEVYFLGSSRYLTGLDLCQNPGAQKVAFLGPTFWDLARVQAGLLRQAKQPITIVSEVLNYWTPPQVRGTDWPWNLRVRSGWVRSLLGFETTRESLKTLLVNALSVGAAPSAVSSVLPPSRSAPSPSAEVPSRGSPDCRPLVPSTMGRDREVQRQEAKAYLQDNGETRDLDQLVGAWYAAFEAAEQVCHETGQRHRIRWLIAPTSQDYWSNPLQQQVVALWQKSYRIAMEQPRPRAGACDIGLVSIALDPQSAEALGWTAPEGWLDYSHFSPVMGKALVEATLGKPGF